jgi:hypothetical protein
VGLVDFIEGARGRKVPRSAERAPQDDKEGESVKRSEEVGYQGGGLSGIGSIGLPKLGAHPFLLHAELEPEHEEDEDDNDEPAHLGDCNRHAKKPGQNAGIDWVTHHGIRTCGDQFVALLNGDGAAPVAAEVLACPDGEEKAGDGEGGSQPEWPITRRPELDVKPASGDRVDPVKTAKSRRRMAPMRKPRNSLAAFKSLRRETSIMPFSWFYSNQALSMDLDRLKYGRLWI